MLVREIFAMRDLAISMIDLGASGQIDQKWRRLLPLLDYIGFEPNAEECERLNRLPHKMRSARFLPYAISDQEGIAPLYTTRSIYCYSLLRPRQEWLRRFSFAPLFEETGQIDIPCTTLDALHASHSLRAEIIKIDTQGMELPILRAANTIIAEGTFCIETETGFTEQYQGETTYAQIDQFMRAQGFLLFDMKTYRVGRANDFRHRGVQQPLWCESIWLRDYLACDIHGLPRFVPNRELALKSLLICEALGCLDYGLELVEYFGRIGLLTSAELVSLRRSSTWRHQDIVETIIETLFRMLPGQLRGYVLDGVRKSIDRPHLLRPLLERARSLWSRPQRNDPQWEPQHKVAP